MNAKQTNNLSDRVRTVMKLAELFALKFGHDKIDTTDVLYGLISDRSSLGLGILKTLGFPDKKIQEIREGIDLQEIPRRHSLKPSATVEKVLKKAVGEGRKLRTTQRLFGTEFLLLGLVSIAGDVKATLAEIEITPEKIILEIIRLRPGDKEN